MNGESTAFGGCACGVIKYVVTLPVKWCSHCHCRACRRQHAAPFVTWFGVDSENFRLAGREHLKWYVCSEEAKRGFCGSCGTPFLYMSTQWPGEVHVARASLTSKVEIRPAGHVHFEQHVPWFPFEDSLPRRGGRTGFEPMDQEAPVPIRRREPMDQEAP